MPWGTWTDRHCHLLGSCLRSACLAKGSSCYPRSSRNFPQKEKIFSSNKIFPQKWSKVFFLSLGGKRPLIGPKHRSFMPRHCFGGGGVPALHHHSVGGSRPSQALRPTLGLGGGGEAHHRRRDARQPDDLPASQAPVLYGHRLQPCARRGGGGRFGGWRILAHWHRPRTKQQLSPVGPTPFFSRRLCFCMLHDVKDQMREWCEAPQLHTYAWFFPDPPIEGPGITFPDSPRLSPCRPGWIRTLGS